MNTGTKTGTKMDAEAQAEYDRMIAEAQRLYEEQTNAPKIDIFAYTRPKQLTAVELRDGYEFTLAMHRSLAKKLREATSVEGVKDIDGLTQVMIRNIQFHTIEKRRATRLLELNRRFGSLARFYGTTVRSILDRLAEDAVIAMDEVRGVSVYYDPIEMVDVEQREINSDKRSKLRDEYIERAFEAMKRK